MDTNDDNCTGNYQGNISLEKNGGVSPRFDDPVRSTENFIDDPGGVENEETLKKEFSTDSATLSGLLQRLLSCLRPVWTILGKASKEHKADPWVIPFDEIYELEWLGSGAQGAVFLGQYGGQQVAVKKVRREVDTDIKHLRNLNHPNIVKFRYGKKKFCFHLVIITWSRSTIGLTWFYSGKWFMKSWVWT